MKALHNLFRDQALNPKIYLISKIKMNNKINSQKNYNSKPITKLKIN